MDVGIACQFDCWFPCCVSHVKHIASTLCARPVPAQPWGSSESDCQCMACSCSCSPLIVLALPLTRPHRHLTDAVQQVPASACCARWLELGGAVTVLDASVLLANTIDTIDDSRTHGRGGISSYACRSDMDSNDKKDSRRHTPWYRMFDVGPYGNNTSMKDMNQESAVRPSGMWLETSMQASL